MIEISGKVTDFNNNPIEGAEIDIKNDKFETVYQTYSKKKGEYRLYVQQGTYLALAACKDYKTKNLEYWAWNIPCYHNLRLNVHINGIEIYAMNAFFPQGAYPSLIIYFRPMSLKRAKKAGIIEVPKAKTLIEIAPDLSKNNMDLQINDKSVDILEINRVREFAGNNQSIIGYLIQCDLPENWLNSEYLRIRMILSDTETKEKGEGCLFWKNIFWKEKLG
jgi:hypothetical protein